MTETFAPQVRIQFARRLKAMRTQRGFQRARYFAASLGIEENRYTRYERAEVEPSLSLIHKMCETLQVSPNELLGFDNGAGANAGADVAGFAEGDGVIKPGEPKGASAVGQLAWALASDVVAIRPMGRKSADPLAVVQETSALYRSLLAEPFETIAKLADEPALKKAPAKRKAEVAALMGRLTAAIQGQAAPR